jgi:hypothetical protein
MAGKSAGILRRLGVAVKDWKAEFLRDAPAAKLEP